MGDFPPRIPFPTEESLVAPHNSVILWLQIFRKKQHSLVSPVKIFITSNRHHPDTIRKLLLRKKFHSNISLYGFRTWYLTVTIIINNSNLWASYICHKYSNNKHFFPLIHLTTISSSNYIWRLALRHFNWKTLVITQMKYRF